MKWAKERDLLIAQTLAFVQSVTGKKTDAEKPDVQSDFEAAPIEAEKIAIDIIAPPRIVQAPRINPVPQIARTPSTGDFRAEIQSRVANFRAHQQRFDREREAYCSATLAKMHASIAADSASAPWRK